VLTNSSFSLELTWKQKNSRIDNRSAKQQTRPPGGETPERALTEAAPEEGSDMATRKNKRTSSRKSAVTTSNQHSGNEALAEFNKFVAEQGPTIIKMYGLEEGDLDGGGLALMAWIASLVKDAERAGQPQVDAAIQYLDPTISA
jgi:hypothetical protein